MGSILVLYIQPTIPTYTSHLSHKLWVPVLNIEQATAQSSDVCATTRIYVNLRLFTRASSEWMAKDHKKLSTLSRKHAIFHANLLFHGAHIYI